MKLYKMVIRDNVPEMVQISDHGTITMPDGKLYWIIPVESEPIPTQPTLQEPQEPMNNENEEERVIALLKKGVRSTSEIARRAGTTPYSVKQIIHAAGLKTPTETLRAKIEEMLQKAGAAGMSTYEIGKLARSQQQIGPMMAGMLRQGKAWRLANGNYAMYQTFNKEGNP